MELERVVWKKTVSEGYVVLLRAQAELMLPLDKREMRAFYEKTARACLLWATEVWGERLRAVYCAMDKVDKARYRAERYQFFMRSPWEDERHLCVLCESTRTHPGEAGDRHRICHFWDKNEETILPKHQILRLLRLKLAKNELPFAPDGIFVEADKIVVFKNPTPKNGFLEAKLPVKKIL